MTLVPAYGRDYASKKAVMEAWKAGKDFIVQDFFSPWDGKPTNITDCKRDGIRQVMIRYKRLTQVALVKI